MVVSLSLLATPTMAPPPNVCPPTPVYPKIVLLLPVCPGAPGQTGSNNTIFGNTGVGGQTFGGGAIVGVASKDKETTIRLFNKKKTYDEWQFIYSPAMDRVNVLLRGPYNGQTLAGTQVGTPAGQLNQANPGASGQQPGGLTTQPGGFGQQNPVQNQQPIPGGQFPPDQNQSQPQQ